MGPSLLRPILVRAASLGVVLIIVLFLLVLTLGATGFSDRILSAKVLRKRDHEYVVKKMDPPPSDRPALGVE